MKQFILCTCFLLLATIVPCHAENATLTIQNRSEYSLTVKIMRANGGLYTTVYISPRSSRTVSFSSSGYFYTKSKAVNGNSTIYKKDENYFFIQCNNQGYSQATMEFYVSSYGNDDTQRISKSEFERDDK